MSLHGIEDTYVYMGMLGLSNFISIMGKTEILHKVKYSIKDLTLCNKDLTFCNTILKTSRDIVEG